MPLDILTMRLGGVLGKGMNALAGIGVKEAAVNNIVKLSGKGLTKEALAKETAEELATRTALAKFSAEKLIDKHGYSALFSQYAPKGAGAIGQASTLATFEGTRGGIQAAVNGEDVWEGIGHGVMHGGIMGGVAGYVGASMNVKYAELFNKASKKGNVLTRAEQRQLGFWRLGKGGQVLWEAGIFTAPEVKNLIMDEDYTFRDLAKSYFTNVGMMGLLKAKHHIWNKGVTSAQDYYKREKARIEAEKAGETALENVQKAYNEGTKETKEQKAYGDEVAKVTNDLIDASIAKTKVTREEYDTFTERRKKAEKAIKEGSELESDLHNVAEMVLEAHGAMVEEIRNFKTDNKTETEAAKRELKKLTENKEAFENEILKELNNIEGVKDRNTVFDDATREKAKFDFKDALDAAKAKGDKELIDMLSLIHI